MKKLKITLHLTPKCMNVIISLQCRLHLSALIKNFTSTWQPAENGLMELIYWPFIKTPNFHGSYSLRVLHSSISNRLYNGGYFKRRKQFHIQTLKLQANIPKLLWPERNGERFWALYSAATFLKEVPALEYCVLYIQKKKTYKFLFPNQRHG